MRIPPLVVLFPVLVQGLADARIPVISIHGMTSTAAMEDGEVTFFNSLPPLTDHFSFHTEEYAANLRTVFFSLKREISNMCKVLNTKPEYVLAPEIILIGHSNGAVVSRGIIETCDLGPGRRVSAFVSVGGPLMGVHALPEEGVPQVFRELFRRILDPLCEMLYLQPFFQEILGPAGYFYRPSDVFNNDGKRWIDGGTVLARLNQEVPLEKREPVLRERMLALDAVLMIRFAYDEVVKPPESEFFGRVMEDGSPVPLNATGPFWDDDLAGLRTLMEEKKLFFYESAHTHDKLSDSDRADVIAPFLLHLMQSRVTQEELREQRVLEVAEFPTPGIAQDPSAFGPARKFASHEEASAARAAEMSEALDSNAKSLLSSSHTAMEGIILN